ncbi:MAG: nitroreductase [Lachnospiraceae bacterium]|nr:nitroreductase [Lachnospiraceae bacterium]
MNEIIRKRKSIRKYDLNPLDAGFLEKLQEKIATLIPLYPDIEYSIEIVSKTKGILGVKAPHYLVFGSESKEGDCENIGFIGQQLDLFFSESGMGACWLGVAKSAEKIESQLPHVISMAFGRPAGSLHREYSEFKRKPLNEMSEGNDERLEAARLAPSAVNGQNWYFIAENDKIHCYIKKKNPLLGLIYNKMIRVDMGIALYHIAVGSESFHFVQEKDAPERGGYSYAGTVTS